MTQAGCKGMSHLFALLWIRNSFQLINRPALKHKLIKRQVWEGKRARDSKININQEALKYHQTKSLNLSLFVRFFLLLCSAAHCQLKVEELSHVSYSMFNCLQIEYTAHHVLQHTINLIHLSFICME